MRKVRLFGHILGGFGQADTAYIFVISKPSHILKQIKLLRMFRKELIEDLKKENSSDA